MTTAATAIVLAAVNVHFPSPAENVQIDDDLRRVLIIDAFVHVLKHMFCIDVPPSTLGCSDPPEPEPEPAPKEAEQ